MAKGDLTIIITPTEIMGSEIMKSGDYKYARVSVKKNDKQYLSISFEWQDAEIPEFVMGLMSWMQSNKEEIEKAKVEFATEYAVLKERL